MKTLLIVLVSCFEFLHFINLLFDLVDAFDVKAETIFCSGTTSHSHFLILVVLFTFAR